jgi:quinol monooxygenase YgiN
MTIRATASFRVKADELETALEAIRTFVGHTRTEPGTLRYESWRSVDRPTEFLHVMEFADETAEWAHGSSDAVRALTDALYPTCEEPPTFGRWDTV